MLSERDDFRHPLRPGPHARESLFYNLHLPEEGLTAFFYTWVDAAEVAGRLFAVFADNDERLVFDLAGGIPAAGKDFDDWEAAGLTVRHAKALDVAELGYRGDGAAFNLKFESMHEAFAYSQNEDGCPPALADDRFEQSGRVSGRLTLGERVIDFDTTAHRDHSWGTRDWDSVHHWKWFSGQAGPHFSFNVLQCLAAGRQWVNGYVNRNGELSPLVKLRTDTTYDEGFGHRTVKAVLVEDTGHETLIELERFSLMRFEPSELIVMHEAGCRGTAGGDQAVTHAEMGWTRDYVRNQVKARQGGGQA